MAEPRRCQAELRHLHGVTRCARDPFHADDLAELAQHVGPCWGCREDGDPYDLHWTGYREKW